MLNISTNEFNQIPTNKISLIKVNKKDNFNTSNIFTKKPNYNTNSLINQNNIDYASDISHRSNTDYTPFNKIKSLRTKNHINNDQFDIVKFQSTCNVLKQKLNQLKNFSKELESHSYDNIRNNSNYSDIKIAKNENTKNDYIRNSLNFVSNINNQNNINYRNKFSTLNLNYTSKKYFKSQKLNQNSINNINEVNSSNKKQYSCDILIIILIILTK